MAFFSTIEPTLNQRLKFLIHFVPQILALFFCLFLGWCHRLSKLSIGLTDNQPYNLEPRAMIPMNLCYYLEQKVGCAESKRVLCQGGGVTGRYLLIQLNKRVSLTLCEVEITCGE